jgi:hypothetical protein
MTDILVFPQTMDGIMDKPGMTLRDWFAGQALAGYTTDPNTENDNQCDIAEWAYSFADAMIAYRNN